jgi:nucleotide-binding universal stress UspA family protein
VADVLLVGYDGSPGALRALRHAIGLAASDRSSLIVAIAVPSALRVGRLPVISAIDPAEFDAPAARRAQRVLDAAVALVPDEVSVTGLTLRGRPSAALLGALRRAGADAIVVGAGSRGRRRDVARTLLRRSPVPVVVVS